MKMMMIGIGIKKISLVVVSLLVCLTFNNDAFINGQVMNSVVNNRTRACTSDPTILGYATIREMNIDQQNELSRIANNQATAVGDDGYAFHLCPDLFMDIVGEGTVDVLLGPKISFMCGPTGTSNGNGLGICELRGGAKQIVLSSSSATSFVKSINFKGLTFSRFTGASIEILSSNLGASLNLEDVIYEEFISKNIIVQNSNIPVTIKNAIIQVPIFTNALRDSKGEDLFLNQGGGKLSIEGLTVMNGVVAESVIRTIGKGDGSSLTSSTFNTSSITSVTLTESGGAQEIRQCTFHDMEKMDQAATAQNSSTLNVANLVIRDNTKATIGGVLSMSGSSVNVSPATVTGNTKLDKAFAATEGGNIDVSEVSFSNNIGVEGTSAVIFAETGGEATASDCTISDNSKIISYFFALRNATLNMYRNCINSGDSNAIVFISTDSKYENSNNFVDDSIQTAICGNARTHQGKRLSQESAESECFMGPGKQCTSTCQPFALLESCGGAPYPTRNPNVPAPTPAPAPYYIPTVPEPTSTSSMVQPTRYPTQNPVLATKSPTFPIPATEKPAMATTKVDSSSASNTAGHIRTFSLLFFLSISLVCV